MLRYRGRDYGIGNHGRNMGLKARPKMSVWKYLSLGYLIAILAGSVLLVLPVAARDGNTSYLDALFTSASATCVTGLVVYDTVTHWSLFGQIVILCLIQLGGLGFTTFVTILFMMVRRGNLGLYERRAVMQSFGGTRLKGAGTLIKRIVIGTVLLEFIGACLLSIRFIADFGWARGIFYSVFHSVSAFCNAGFDLLGKAAPFSSLSAYQHDPLVVLTVSALIIVGGLGFCIWGDVSDRKFNLKKCQFYTKFILVVNSAILVLSVVLFCVFERNNAAFGSNFGEKLLSSIFNAAAARTAGFSTSAPEALSQSGFLLTVILMFIGGCSGSTAGGVKVSTFAVIVMGMWSNLRGRRDINLGKHRLDYTLVGQALAIFVAYLSLVLFSTLIILSVETDASFSAVLFETVSAIGTVGLSFSLTPALSVVSKLILILLMYMGRVGILTLAFALRVKRSEPEVRRPLVDTLYIG